MFCNCLQIAVVTFGETANSINIPKESEDEPCFNDHLAHASSSNKRRIRSVLDRLHIDPCVSFDSRTCSSRLTSRYSVAFRKAIEIHERVTPNSKRTILMQSCSFSSCLFFFRLLKLNAFIV